MYWLTSSLFSMGQIYLLQLPSFRSLMGIPDLIKHDDIKKDGKGVVATFKSGKLGLVILPHNRRKVNCYWGCNSIDIPYLLEYKCGFLFPSWLWTPRGFCVVMCEVCMQKKKWKPCPLFLPCLLTNNCYFYRKVTVC